MKSDDSILTRLPSEVAEAIDRNGLIRPGEGVVVGVSGGLDSVVLLEVLRELAARQDRRWRLVVAHLDHGLRDESADDARFVTELAHSRGLDCVVERREVARIAEQKGAGLEETARNERMAFLRRVAIDRGWGRVALAHHADDQVETALFRLFRGAHLRGLAGMLPSRPMGEGVRLIRPMLGIRRQRLREFAEACGLAWREDATNRDTDLSRNYIRHDLLPRLRERLNPRVDEAVLRAIGAAGEAAELLDGVAEQLLQPECDGCVSLSRSGLVEAESATVRQAVRLALERVGGPMDRLGADWTDRLARMAVDGEGLCDLPGGLRAWMEGESLWIGPVERAWRERESFEVVVPVGGSVLLPDGLEVRTWREEEAGEQDWIRRARELPGGTELMDADAIRGELTVRTRREGDRLQPLGLDGSQSVSELLGGAGVPPRRRGRTLCVCDREGIVYVWPVRLAARVALRPGTRTCLGVAIGPVDRW